MLGVILAIAQPGGLGDDDDTTDRALAPTTTSVPADLTTTTLPIDVTTTIAGSGLNVNGPASGGQDGTGDTGAESLLGPGLALLGLGLVLRRVRHSAEA